MEEDLHYKLRTMQDMFTSTRPVSILYLRGSEQDDPDLHPVALVGEPLDLTKLDAQHSAILQQRNSEDRSSGPLSLVSPASSSFSLQNMKQPGQWSDFQSISQTEAHSNPQQLASPPDQISKIPKVDDAGNLTSWIEATDVDSSYKPPVENRIKPVACFYVRRQEPSQSPKTDYYRAIYLAQRTLEEFTNRIASKWNLDPTKITRTTRVLSQGLQVEVDDDVIREMAEGQDLIMEISKQTPSVKREWEMSVDPSAGSPKSNEIDTYELRLIF